MVRKAANENSSIQWLGRQPMNEVLKLIGGASFLVFPSQWYEGSRRYCSNRLPKARR